VPGCFEVVETLSGVLVSQAIDALEFKDDLIFDDQVGHVLSNTGALIFDGIQDLGLGADSLKRQFFEESPLVNLLQEPATEDIGDFKHGLEYPICQRIESAFINADKKIPADLSHPNSERFKVVWPLEKVTPERSNLFESQWSNQWLT